MTEREDTIERIERVLKLTKKSITVTIPKLTAERAVSMLKEQEAVVPFYEEGEDFLNYFMKHTMGRCGHCKAPLPALEGMRSKFCWMCGRQVKWNERK